MTTLTPTIASQQLDSFAAFLNRPAPTPAAEIAPAVLRSLHHRPNAVAFSSSSFARKITSNHKPVAGTSNGSMKARSNSNTATSASAPTAITSNLPASAASSTPTPTVLFGGPRQLQRLAAASKKKNPLLAALSSAPALVTFQQQQPPMQKQQPQYADQPMHLFEEEQKESFQEHAQQESHQYDEAQGKQSERVYDRNDANNSDIHQQLDATTVATKPTTKRVAMKRSRRARSDESEEDDEKDPENDDQREDVEEEEEYQPQSRQTRGTRATTRRNIVDTEDDFERNTGDGDDDENDASSSDSSDENDDDEDAPILAASSAAASSSTPKPKRKKSVPSIPRPSVKPAKPVSGAISQNYKRHDTGRKNGIARGPKTAKALRNEKWRQAKGRVSKTEWKRRGELEKEEKMYCDLLDSKELAKVLQRHVGVKDRQNLPGAEEDENMSETDQHQHGDEDLARLRQFERQYEEEQKLAREQAQIVSMKPAAHGSSQHQQPHHTDASLLKLLREQFKYDAFRPGQLETVKKVLGVKDGNNSSSAASSSPHIHNNNVLSILPTGGGKSLIYQFLSYLLPGLTLIISPLLSLMNDQLSHLPPFLHGRIWSSELTAKEVYDLMQDLKENKVKILFVSPEKVLTAGFQRFMKEEVIGGKRKNGLLASSSSPPSISLVVIDEVHCLAEWSHNFRVSYSRLNYVLFHVLKVERILGLTATATRKTVQAVCENLRIESGEEKSESSELSSSSSSSSSNIVRVPLFRNNLILSVSKVRHDSRFSSVLDLLQAAPFKHLNSIIIYVNYKSVAESLTKYLRSQQVLSCDYYHAGLALHSRRTLQQKFMSNKLRLLVATCAFGMGLDKPDIRGIIHFNLPKSIEAYSQEIGRAGRDGAVAYCHTMWCESDREISASLVYSNGVDREQLRKLMKMIFEERRDGAATGQHLPQSTGMQDEDDEDTPILQHFRPHRRRYISLDIEHLRVVHELSEEVCGTILSRLERSLGLAWIHLVGLLHNTVCIGFHKRNPKILAETSPVIYQLLVQNQWIQKDDKSSQSYHQHGVRFDHERIGGQQDQQHQSTPAAAASSSSISTLEYNSLEYQQLRQQHGLLSLNLVLAAEALQLDIQQVQSELMKLKAAGEISVKWEQMAFIVEVLEIPKGMEQDDEGDHEMNAPTASSSSSSPSIPTFSSLLTSLHSYLQQQESISSEKLSIMEESLKISTLPQMNCDVKHARERVERGRRVEMRKMKMEEAKKNGDADAIAALQPLLQEDEEADVPFFDLHQVMDAYFQTDDTSQFLEQLKQQYLEAECDANMNGSGIRTAASSSSSSAQQQRLRQDQRTVAEFESDLSSFLRTHGDAITSGRELARICHGLKAPSHVAVTKQTKQRERRQNYGRGSKRGGRGGGAPPEDDDMTSEEHIALSPYIGHFLWGRYKNIEFPIVLARCEQALMEWQQQAMVRQQQQERRPRAVKRQKIESESSPPTSTSSASSLPHTAASTPTLPLAAATTLAAPSSTASEDVVVPCSDNEDDNESVEY